MNYAGLANLTDDELVSAYDVVLSDIRKAGVSGERADALVLLESTIQWRAHQRIDESAYDSFLKDILTDSRFVDDGGTNHNIFLLTAPLAGVFALAMKTDMNGGRI